MFGSVNHGARTKRALVSTLFLLAAANFACSSASAKLKVDPSAAATLHIPKGYEKSKMLGGNTQLLFLAPDRGACKGLKYITGFNWSDKNDVVKQKLIPAGHIVTLYALGKINTDGGYNLVQINSCARTVRFTPEAGRHYDFVQKLDLSASCDVKLVDRETNAPPADLEMIEGPYCKGL